MKALAKAGYLVVAPNHQDALSRSNFLTRPEIGFLKSEEWTENTYKSRRDDILNLLAALKSEPNWNDRLDWGKLALVGHSLGGYTALGLGGAWPGWKIPEVKAVLALSPYCKPFTFQNTLSHLNLPVMYQGGTRDNGITPTLEGPEGAFAKTSSPVYFVDFDGFTHFSWTGLNRNEQKQELVNHYSLAFLNKYLKSDKSANPSAKLPGVAFIQVK
jgi:predicted dienelactone hydrolase